MLHQNHPHFICSFSTVYQRHHLTSDPETIKLVQQWRCKTEFFTDTEKPRFAPTEDNR